MLTVDSENPLGQDIWFLIGIDTSYSLVNEDLFDSIGFRVISDEQIIVMGANGFLVYNNEELYLELGFEGAQFMQKFFAHPGLRSGATIGMNFLLLLIDNIFQRLRFVRMRAGPEDATMGYIFGDTGLRSMGTDRGLRVGLVFQGNISLIDKACAVTRAMLGLIHCPFGSFSIAP